MISKGNETSSLSLLDRLIVAIRAVDTRQKYGRALVDLATAVLVAHREEVRHLTDQTQRSECSAHFAYPAPWPCGQVRAVARVLGVDL